MSALQPKWSRHAKASSACVGTLMVALYLAVYVVGAASGLHHWLHDDAHAETHHCVIKMVAQGEVLQSSAEIFITASFHFTRPARHFIATFVVEPDYLLQPGRAPPIPS